MTDVTTIIQCLRNNVCPSRRVGSPLHDLHPSPARVPAAPLLLLLLRPCCPEDESPLLVLRSRSKAECRRCGRPPHSAPSESAPPGGLRLRLLRLLLREREGPRGLRTLRRRRGRLVPRRRLAEKPLRGRGAHSTPQTGHQTASARGRAGALACWRTPVCFLDSFFSPLLPCGSASRAAAPAPGRA